MIRWISLPWRWFLGLALLWMLSLLVLNWGLRLALPGYLSEQIDEELRRHVMLVEPTFAPLLRDAPSNGATMHSLAEQLATHTGLRVTIMDNKGTVVAESGKPFSALPAIENHWQRPEIQQAIDSDVGYATRTSVTVKRPLRYAAGAIRDRGELIGFVRVAMSLDEITGTINHVVRTVAVVSLVIGLLTLPVVYKISCNVTEPIRGMQEMATRVAAGDFKRRAPTEGGPELERLGQALNEMSEQLELRLNELTREKAELNATLSNMVEGVLVVDAARKIRLANRAMRENMGLTNQAIGKTVMEAFRSPHLQELVTHALEGQTASAQELSFSTDDSRVFDVNAAGLKGHDGNPTGVVVVLHDITRIKKLENIRKEFVANVSHELRTPLSIIKGYVETLLDETPPSPEESRKFLETIAKHSRRLEVLIGDLLTISALESQQAKLALDQVSLRQVADGVIEELALQAKARTTTVSLEMPDDLPAVRADAQRVHQILFNLLDNAIKYTQPGGQVWISARPDNSQVEVCVADNGPGISPEHLPHIFERFYRVDKARSRELGGTGLGLSIVKHIALAHGGRAWAESDLDRRGSRFYFTLPRG
jgi:two-component system phosphate regulon sensor histidine kinase PhoR